MSLIGYSIIFKMAKELIQLLAKVMRDNIFTNTLTNGVVAETHYWDRWILKR